MLIYKQELPTDTIFPIKVNLPFSDKEQAKKFILKLDLQYDSPVMWYQADAQENESREFIIAAIGTGHDWKDELDRDDYIGTILIDEGTLVLHYFILEADSDSETAKGLSQLCDTIQKIKEEFADDEPDNVTDED